MTILGRRPSRFLTCALVLGVILVSCARHEDRFWPDTENELLELTDPRILAGDPDRLIRLVPTGDPGLPSAVRRLSHILRIGDRAVVAVAVPVNGEYRRGGGWVFQGQRFTGRHGASGELVSVESSRPDVLMVNRDQHGNLELSALAHGESTVTISATLDRRTGGQPASLQTFTDTVVFIVEQDPTGRDPD